MEKNCDCFDYRETTITVSLFCNFSLQLHIDNYLKWLHSTSFSLDFKLQPIYDWIWLTFSLIISKIVQNKMKITFRWIRSTPTFLSFDFFLTIVSRRSCKNIFCSSQDALQRPEFFKSRRCQKWPYFYDPPWKNLEEFADSRWNHFLPISIAFLFNAC